MQVLEKKSCNYFCAKSAAVEENIQVLKCYILSLYTSARQTKNQVLVFVAVASFAVYAAHSNAN